MEKLIILDYSDTSVHIFDIDSEAKVDESYIEDMGFHCSNCQWMFASDLSLHFHEEVLK